MQETVVRALRAQRPQLRARWEDLLRIERASSPLAHPDALVHLLDWTLDEIFQELANPLCNSHAGRRSGAQTHPPCPCGRNPLLAYYAAGEQALQEALVLAQSHSSEVDPTERDTELAGLNLALAKIARREIEAFCGVCQYRHPPAEGAAAEPRPGHAGDASLAASLLPHG